MYILQVFEYMYSITCKIIYTVVKFEIDISVSQCLGHLLTNIILNRNSPWCITICGTAWMHRKINDDFLSSSYLAITVFWNRHTYDKWLLRDPGDRTWYNDGTNLHVFSLQPTRIWYDCLATGWRCSARSAKMRRCLRNKPYVC